MPKMSTDQMFLLARRVDFLEMGQAREVFTGYSGQGHQRPAESETLSKRRGGRS